MRLKDKVAIVTGGSGGIGKGIVKLFSEEGAKVIIAEIDQEAGEKAVQDFKNDNLEVYFCQTDVSNEESVKSLMKFVEDTFDRLDILINNAALTMRKAVHETTIEEWNTTLGVNLTGPFLCSKHAIPIMKNQDASSIVNVTSWHAQKTITRLAAYASSKGGLDALTRQMSLDYGKYNIRINCVGPSTVDTPAMRAALGGGDDPEKAFEDSLKYIPMGHFATIDDIAKACLFFSSDDSTFISGQTIIVDGGQINKVARPLEFD